MRYKIPTFKVKKSYSTDVDPMSLIDDPDVFNRSIVQFIMNKTENVSETSNVLCYIIDERGQRVAMILEKSGWLKSINKALEYFEKIEEYETCELIKQLKATI